MKLKVINRMCPHTKKEIYSVIDLDQPYENKSIGVSHVVVANGQNLDDLVNDLLYAIRRDSMYDVVELLDENYLGGSYKT